MYVYVLHVLLDEKVSQIFNLGLTFHFIGKKSLSFSYIPKLCFLDSMK